MYVGFTFTDFSISVETRLLNYLRTKKYLMNQFPYTKKPLKNLVTNINEHFRKQAPMTPNVYSEKVIYSGLTHCSVNP